MAEALGCDAFYMSGGQYLGGTNWAWPDYRDSMRDMVDTPGKLS